VGTVAELLDLPVEDFFAVDFKSIFLRGENPAVTAGVNPTTLTQATL
jgi:hypothetical protein